MYFFLLGSHFITCYIIPIEHSERSDGHVSWHWIRTAQIHEKYEMIEGSRRKKKWENLYWCLIYLESYWQIRSNRRRLFEDFAKTHGFDPLLSTNWYSVKQDDFSKAKVILSPTSYLLFTLISFIPSFSLSRALLLPTRFSFISLFWFNFVHRELVLCWHKYTTLVSYQQCLMFFLISD